METNGKKKRRQSGFTLVELIIVIMILSVLAVIAIMSFQGYTTSARDSMRMSTSQTIYKGLEVFMTKTGKFPLPDEYVTVDGLSYQGTVSEGIARMIQLSGNYKDPKDETKYMYSLTLGKTKAQVGIFLEEAGAYQVGFSPSVYAEAQRCEQLYSYGQRVGIFLDENTCEPIQDSHTGTLDIETFSGSFYVQFTNTDSNSGRIVGSGASLKETVAEIQDSCVLGSTSIRNGGSIVAYKSSTVAYGTTCETSVRKCSNGFLDGDSTYKYDKCGVADASNCQATTDASGYSLPSLSHLSTGSGSKDITNGIQTIQVTCSDGTYSYGAQETHCVEDYILTEGGECILGTCSGTFPTNAVLNGTQGDKAWGYSETAGVCKFVCSEGYYYAEDGSCQSHWSGTATSGYVFKNASGITLSPSSCQDLLDQTTWKNTMVGSPWNGTGFQSGVYYIKPSSESAFKAYCDMTSNSGGWTLVVAQFESDPVTNWNEGIQSDYDPSLATSKGFALNTSQIPEHNQIAFGSGINATYIDYANGIYTTGDIPVTYLKGQKTGNAYQMHRANGNYFGNHDPETTYGDYNIWNNTLTFDKIGGIHQSWSFSPNHTGSLARGFGLNGGKFTSSDSNAWSVWVRKVSGNFLLGANGGYKGSDGTYSNNCSTYLSHPLYQGEGTGHYWIKPDSNPPFIAYCDMAYNGGGRTLIGRGRENWNFTGATVNQGTNITNMHFRFPAYGYATPAYYSSGTINLKYS